MSGEDQLIKDRYARRSDSCPSSQRTRLLCMAAERNRIYHRLLASSTMPPMQDLKLLEIGCGHGSDLRQFMEWGMSSCNIAGSELLPERAAATRDALPDDVRILEGDARKITEPDESFDVVFCSTVFTSILDDRFQEQLADRMWRLVRPGGAILWYDFTVDNPRNPDVRGVPVKRVRELFPAPPEHVFRVTLAPPVARLVCGMSPRMYDLLNLLPFLRTHVIAWIPRPGHAFTEGA